MAEHGGRIEVPLLAPSTIACYGARMTPLSSPNEQVFAPAPVKLGAHLLYTVIGLGIVGPLFCWWKKAPPKIWIPVVLVAIVVVVLRELWTARFRGRDLVHLAPEGIRVTNRRGAWLLGWNQIRGVHRYNEQLVFETAPPHARRTLSLDGHDDHDDALVHAISSRVPMTDLRLGETITSTF
jgi:hypothetical protein